MFLCRGARLSASALKQAFKPSRILEFKSNVLRDATWTLPTNYSLQCCRALGASAGVQDSLFLHQTDDLTAVKNWDSSRFLITDQGPFGRVATIAVNLSQTQLTFSNHIFGYSSPRSDVNRCQSIRAPQTILFTAGANVSTPSFFTTTMQTRASSTAAATQKRDTRAGETHTDNKGGELEVKEISTASSYKSPGETEPEQVKPSKTQQLKNVFKEYGAVGVSFHVAISLMSLGMVYLLVSSGIDMAAVLCKLGFSETVVQSKMAAGTSTFVLAYAVHKLFAPVRISMTLVSVPLIVRYFRKTGLFKPPTAAP